MVSKNLVISLFHFGFEFGWIDRVLIYNNL